MWRGLHNSLFFVNSATMESDERKEEDFVFNCRGAWQTPAVHHCMAIEFNQRKGIVSRRFLMDCTDWRGLKNRLTAIKVMIDLSICFANSSMIVSFRIFAHRFYKRYGLVFLWINHPINNLIQSIFSIWKAKEEDFTGVQRGWGDQNVCWLN